MGQFSWDGRHFEDLAAFRSYVKAMPRPSWIRGITVHHTWSPTVAEWHGASTLGGIRRYYEYEVKNQDGSIGWPAGPHLFSAPDGIWYGTPLSVHGVHAGPCNSTCLGVEVVGNYDRGAWQEPIRSQTFQVLAVLLEWLQLPVTALRGHRDCMPGHKSCPGWGITMDWVQAGVKDAMAKIYQDELVIGRGPSLTKEQWTKGLEENGGGEILQLNTEGGRVYDFMVGLDIDPAFFLALWVLKGGRPLGRQQAQAQTRNPLLLKEKDGKIGQYSSFQLGLFHNVLYLKEECGAKGLQMVSQVVKHVMAGISDIDAEGMKNAIINSMEWRRGQK